MARKHFTLAVLFAVILLGTLSHGQAGPGYYNFCGSQGDLCYTGDVHINVDGTDIISEPLNLISSPGPDSIPVPGDPDFLIRAVNYIDPGNIGMMMTQSRLTMDSIWTPLPGVVYGSPSGPKGNLAGGCPLGSCHTLDGLYRPLRTGVGPGLLGMGYAAGYASTIGTLDEAMTYNGFNEGQIRMIQQSMAALAAKGYDTSALQEFVLSDFSASTSGRIYGMSLEGGAALDEAAFSSQELLNNTLEEELFHNYQTASRPWFARGTVQAFEEEAERATQFPEPKFPH